MYLFYIITSRSNVTMGPRKLIVNDARLQIGDPTVILAKVRDSQCSFMLFTRLKDIAIIQIDYSIADIVSDIILLRLTATL